MAHREALSLDERISRQVVEDDYRVSRLIAEGTGRPPNTDPVSTARELDLWNETDDTFDETLAWQQHLADGTLTQPDGMSLAAYDVATKKYPNRLPLMKSGRPRVSEQIAYANRMAARTAAQREREGHPASTDTAVTDTIDGGAPAGGGAPSMGG